MGYINILELKEKNGVILGELGNLVGSAIHRVNCFGIGSLCQKKARTRKVDIWSCVYLQMQELLL